MSRNILEEGWRMNLLNLVLCAFLVFTFLSCDGVLDQSNSNNNSTSPKPIMVGNNQKLDKSRLDQIASQLKKAEFEGEERTIKDDDQVVGANSASRHVVSRTDDDDTIASSTGNENNNVGERNQTFVKPWHTGVIGCYGVSFSSNSDFDSYNSTTGKKKLGNGSIISLMPDSPITLSGNVTVKGDVMTYGKNSDITLTSNSDIAGPAKKRVVRSTGKITTKGNADIDGPTAENAEAVSFDNNCDPLDLATLFKDVKAGKTATDELIVAGNDEETLQSGVYHYKKVSITSNATLTLEGPGEFIFFVADEGEFTISGNASFNISKKATLSVYATGKVNISGNGMVNENVPADFVIMSAYKGSGEGVKVGGNSDFVGVIYAPYTEVHFTSNGTMMGAVRGKKVVNSGNFTLLYDEALGSLYKAN